MNLAYIYIKKTLFATLSVYIGRTKIFPSILFPNITDAVEDEINNASSDAN